MFKNYSKFEELKSTYTYKGTKANVCFFCEKSDFIVKRNDMSSIISISIIVFLVHVNVMYTFAPPQCTA